MAQIKNYQQLELLSTNFLRRDETDPLTIASLDVVGNVDIGGDLDVIGTITGLDHGDLDGLGDDDHNDATNGYVLREPNAGVTDNALVRWDGIGGRNLQNSGVILTDTNNMSGINDLDVGGTLGVTGLATVDDLNIGGDLDVTGNTSGIDHGDLDGRGDDDHNDATNGYILREPNAGVENNHLAIWDGTGGRNLKNSSTYISGDHLYCDGWIYSDYDATQYTKIGGNNIELGAPGKAGGTSYVDFHGDPTESDYDARIYVSGGTGTTGYGEMTLTARGGINLTVSPNDVYINNDIKIASTGDYYHGTYVGYIYHPCNAVKVLDISTSDDTSRNIIDMSGKGFPTAMQAVNVRIAVQDSGANANDCYVVFYDASAGGNTTGTFSPMPAVDRYGRYTAILNCGSNGDIWWTAEASGTSTLDIVAYVTGYFI